MDDYIKFLTAFVTDLGLNVDNADYIRQRDDGSTPLTIDGRRLVLPTMTHRRSMSDDKVLLHPVAENVLAELSPVTRTLLKVAGCNLNIMFIVYGTELIQVAGDTGRQTKLSNKQLDLLDKLRSCASSEEKDIARIIQKFLMGLYNENQSGAFIRLGLSRGRIYRGSKRHRVGSVVFPLYEDLIADREKSRKESKHGLAEDVRETIIELHEALFPACAEEEAYGFCDVTSRHIAPFFVTFAKTYGQMGAEFRRIQEILTGLVTFTQEDEAPRGDWAPYLEDNDILRKWMNAIPDTSTYTGPADKDEEVTSSVDKEETVAYMGPRVMNSQGQLEELPPPAQVTEKTRSNQPSSKVDYIDPQDFARRFGGTSAFSLTQTANSTIKRYIDGYAKFWDKHVATYRIAPHGMPHPQQVVKGMLPPNYEGAPALPPGFYPGGSATTAVMPTMPMQGMMMPQAGMMMPQQGMMMGQGGMMYPQQQGMMMPQGVMMYPQGAMMMPQGGMMMGTSVNPMMNPAMNPNIHPAMMAVGAGGGAVSPGTI